MKKLLAAILTVCMALTLLSGCGTGTQSDAGEETALPEATEPAVIADETPDDEGSVPEEHPEGETVSISYPISDGDTITAWLNMPPPLRDSIEEFNDIKVLANIAEATGINVDFVTIGDTTASERFSMMIAGGDWTDLIPISFYGGGAAQAYEDDVIVDLTDLLQTNAPDYWASAQAMDEKSQAAMCSGDKYLSIGTLLSDFYLIQGPCVRQDWLDELNMDVPTDLDSYTDMLKAFYDNYHPDYTIYTADGGLDYLSDLFGTKIAGYSTMDGGLPKYVDGGSVICSYTTDEYREFLEWFVDMYKYGVINKDFYNVNVMDNVVRNTNIAEGQIGYWAGRCESIDEWREFTTDETILSTANPQGVGFLTDGDGVFNWADEQSLWDTRACYSITASCEKPEIALQFLNYFFTDEGIIIANYGAEGYTWEYNDKHEVTYTDVVLNNADGYTAQLAVNVFTSNIILPCYSIEDKLFVSYCDNAQKAIELYNTNVTDDHAYPSAAALTTEEVAEVTGTVATIMTYSAEQLLQFMTAGVELNDDTWSAYVDQMNELGLQEVLGAYQNAYEKYLTNIG